MNCVGAKRIYAMAMYSLHCIHTSILCYSFSLVCSLFFFQFFYFFSLYSYSFVLHIQYDDIHRHSKIYYGMLASATAQTSIQFSLVQFNSMFAYVYLCMCFFYALLLLCYALFSFLSLLFSFQRTYIHSVPSRFRSL